MGTVGLNFGSPTSGTGFDVSTTVSEIVSNLQNIETPWKNQLTTLQSQDTVISNLGTLFSTVSTDLSKLTGLEGDLAEKTGSSSDTNVLELTSASASAAAGTHTVIVNSLAQTSSGYLAEIANANDTLSGAITLAVGSGTAQTFTLDSSDNTLAGLASAINSSGVGITASVLTDATGSRLSLVSATSGANGNITVSNNSLADASAANTLAYTAAAGSNGGASTAGTLAPVASLSDVLSGQISIQVGSSPAQIVDVPPGGTLTDLMNAINNTSGIGVTASTVTNSDGTTSLSIAENSGASGALTVSSAVVDPATALGYTAAATGSNASLTVDGVNLSSASNTVTDLIPGLTFQLLSTSPEEAGGSLEPVQVIIANNNSQVETDFNQFVTDYNSLISALNTQEGDTSSGTPQPLYGSPTLALLQQQLLSGLNAQNPNGYLAAVSTANDPSLSGSISIQVGGKTAQVVTLTSTQTSLADLAAAINNADIGVIAGVATSNGQSMLTLTSQTDGAAGALTVNSSIVNTSASPIASTVVDSDGSQNSTATFASIPSGNDLLSGSVTIQTASGSAVTVDVPDSPNNNLAGLANAINGTAGVGVTATVVDGSNGAESLSLVSKTAGSSGDLIVTSNLLDTTNTTNTTLNYTNSSNVANLTDLGVSVNDDGSLSFDDSTLDALLNSDYSSVVGFFQGANSWGQNFAAMLSNSGNSSSTGILALASSSNSSVESQLNAKISSENSLISTEQSSLTAELNQANEILEELPSELNGMNELYSAVTGYDQNING